MTPERWQQIERLYHLALEQRAEDRETFLEGSCGEDAALRKQVASLLASTDDADTYLETPALPIASRRTNTPTMPTHLGRYQLTAELGKGGMGAVYRGVDPAIGRTVAIKTILPGRQDSPEEAVQLRERLRREARAAGALDHPNIVTVFDVGEEAGVNYIVMELIEGVTLDELLHQTTGLLPTAQVMAILTGSARALDYAHARGVVHRDVKPANIMIRHDGSVKLADFGIAKLAAATTLTAVGNIAGTPCFLSPEQLQGHEVTARSDQFSLAVVAWMLLTGSKPFDAEELVALLSSILMKDPPPNNRLTPAVDSVLRRALEKDPARRFESCGAFIEALQNASSGALAPSHLPPARKRRVAWITGVTAALALAAGLTIYSLRPNRHSEPPARQPETVAKQPHVVDKPPSTPAQQSTSLHATTPPSIVPPSKTPPAHSPDSVSGRSRVSSTPPQADRSPVAGAVKVHPIDSLPYVWIPAGKLEMGCSSGDRDCADDEKPSHAIALAGGFWMTQTETTVKAYRRFTQATGRPMPPEPLFSGRSLNAAWADGAQPIIGVTWTEAKAYCEWAGLRLPTEAEWEYAARAGDFRPSYGPSDSIAWFADNSGRSPLNSTDLWRNDQAHYVDLLKENENGPHRVGQKMANKFGLRDMLGNVWEWANDWYAKDYYSLSPDLDPPGPSSGQARVLRGGSWYNGPRFIRASQRHPTAPETRSNYNGFRCAGKTVNGGAP